MCEKLNRRQAVLRSHFGKKEDASQDDENGLMYRFGSEPEALLYAALFVPEFLEVDGEVYFRGIGLQIEEGRNDLALRMQSAKAKSTADFEQAVESCNWVEVPYLFSNPTDDDYQDADSELLASLIVEAWLSRLRYLYPNRQFVVRVINAEETGGVTGVGFNELKSRLKA